ncbi:MAG TPA: hypothetical protein DCZ10_10770 [Pelotomaculum sp.]|nr:hypothetical protein [Pelotomaculum sp.]
MQYNMIIKMTLKNKLLMIIFLCLLFSFIFTVNAFASQGPSIFDVKASAINIRTGPSLSYSIISVQPNDADFPQFTANYPNDLAPVSGSGYDWLKVYYPNASYGEYTNLAVG